jgi:tRNA threonylcarbamoyl adenosine modification protein YeaZ/ribosomal-protein-alanine acetyltransferase
MLTLAFDTSMGACSAAVFNAAEGKLLAEALEPMERGHAERLAPMIAEVMEQADVAFAQLGRVVVTTGPGTFTGLRIGLAMARGFGVSLGVPLIGINSLAAIAANEAEQKAVAVAVEARNGEIYFALYGSGGEEIVAPLLTRPVEAAKLLPSSPVVVLGTGARHLLPEHTVHVRGNAGDVPRASQFVKAASGLDPAHYPPNPLYLRQPDIKPQFSVQRVPPGQRLAAKLLADLHGECFEAGWSSGEFASLLATPNTQGLIILQGGEASGFGLYRSAADEAEILTLAMRPSFRRRGLGRALVSEIEKHVRETGARKLFLEVAASNSAARALYSRAGFEEAGRRKDYYARGAAREDALVLRKTL